MSRSPRRIAPLLSSLLLGAATATGVTLAAGTITGCADENDPATWVKRLDDATTRPQAVSRLIQFYEDKMTQDKGDRNGAQVKPLLEQIVEPMTQRCVAGDLDDRTNGKLIKFLADTRDPKAEPCFIKTLKDYKPDQTEEDTRAVCRAIAAMKLKSAAGPLFEVFTKVKASKPKAQASNFPREVHDAMIALDDPSWEPQLISYLGHVVDQKEQATFTDEMFWQITAAEILGRIKSEKAVKPLLKLMLAPAKAAGQGDAVLALVKIGKPAIGPTVALLRGEDKELVDFSKAEVMKAAAGNKEAEKAAGTAYVGAAALVLATIGREETSAPLVEAIGKTDDKVAQAIMARELTKVPRSPATIKAFQDVFDKLPVNLSIPNSRGGAREVLLDVAPNFFDASFVPWIFKSVKDMKGSDDDLSPIRERAMEAILKLATKDQTKFIDDMAGMKAGEGTLGKGYDKEIKNAKKLLEECSDKIDCYLGKLTDPNVNKDDNVSIGVKAAYQIGILGNTDVRSKIMAAYPKISHPSIRFASLTVIDVHSPKGDAGIAGTLQKIVDDAVASKDADKQRFNPTLKQFIYRLNARAQ
jgi:HEAT repeat protein